MSKRNGWTGTPAQRARRLLNVAVRTAWADGVVVTCPRCGEAISPGQAWDVGHRVDIVEDPTQIWNAAGLRAEHARCNRAAGAELTNSRTRAQRQRLRQW